MGSLNDALLRNNRRRGDPPPAAPKPKPAIPAPGSPEEGEAAMKRLNRRVQSGSLGRANSLVSEAKAKAAVRKVPEVPGVSLPKAASTARSTGRGGGGALGRGSSIGVPPSGRGGGGAAGRLVTTAPKPAPKPMSTMDKIRADKGLMGTIKADAAAMKKSAPAAPAAKPSSGLSANKSYSDYKKLMGD